MSELNLKKGYENYIYFEGYYYLKVLKVNREKYSSSVITLKCAYPEYHVHTKQVGSKYYLLLNKVNKLTAEIKAL